MRYSEEVKKHIATPQNKDKLQKAQLVGIEGNPNQGPFVKIFINTKEETIKEISFSTFRCPCAIACCSKLTQMVQEKLLKEAILITSDQLIKELGGLPLGKIYCGNMAVIALRKAIAEYYC